MIEGIIKGEETAQILSNFNFTVDSSEQDFLNILRNANSENIADIEVTYWIEKESGYGAKIELDMTAAANSIIKELAANSDRLTMEELTINLEMSNFNAATEFLMPES